MAPTTWIVVAFVTALVVMVIAATSSVSSRRGLRQFVADVGLSVRHRPSDADGGARETGAGGLRPTFSTAGAADLPEDEEGGVAELFDVGEVPESAYVDPTPLTEPIARMTRSLRSLVRS
jgi:hypothetical protein